MLEMAVSFMWLLADGTVVGGGEAGCFKHVASSEGVGEDGSEVVVELMGWLSVVGWEGGSDVFEDWAVRFSVK
jgi:hypothetical protein